MKIEYNIKIVEPVDEKDKDLLAQLQESGKFKESVQAVIAKDLGTLKEKISVDYKILED